jgi:hypothetical protein
MSELLQPKDALEVVALDLHQPRPSAYLRRLLTSIGDEEMIAPAARWYMDLRCAGKSDYLENKDLDHNLGKASFTMPTTVALALCTVVPTDASTGATITEASYTGYARKVIAAAALTSASGGQSSNSETLTFAACTAGSSTIIAYAICDNSTKGAGNVLYWGTSTSTVISTTQTPPNIAAAQLVVNED